jgi:two-component system cell cycle response regulator DivK
MGSANRSGAGSPLILVVDDDEDSREICALTLQCAGFRTEEAENGSVAVDLALALAPDAILMDQIMPVMDGPEAARRLRTDARTQDTPIVMLTGFGADSTRGRAVRADGHCDAYLDKPCAAEQIIASLRAVLLVSSAARLPLGDGEAGRRPRRLGSG